MDKEKLSTICLTIFGLGVCVMLASMVSSCVVNDRNSREIGLKQRELELKQRDVCLDKGGSLLAGPNGSVQCVMLGKN